MLSREKMREEKKRDFGGLGLERGFWSQEKTREREKGGKLLRENLEKGVDLSFGFLKEGRAILYSKELYINLSPLRAKLGALKCLQ